MTKKPDKHNGFIIKLEGRDRILNYSRYVIRMMNISDTIYLLYIFTIYLYIGESFSSMMDSVTLHGFAR